MIAPRSPAHPPVRCDRSFDVVIPSTFRGSLAVLLRALGEGSGPLPDEVIVVDDRPPGRPARARVAPGADGDGLAGAGDSLGPLAERVRIVPGEGRGPAAARNAGWRAGRSTWVAFLDDDVIPGPEWRAELESDIAASREAMAAVQGRVEVPLPARRRPTDWERNVSGLESAVWATADMAYRREALLAAGGFDERFRRAYREDSDLGLRLRRAGWHLSRGRRRVRHPPGPAGRWVSLRLQSGNADDVLMRALHGRRWREAAGAPAGRRGRHVAVTAAGVTALGALAGGRRRIALAAGAAWCAGTGELVVARVAPGPRTAREVALMVVTSLAMPPLAVAHTLRGLVRAPALVRRPGATRVPAPPSREARAPVAPVPGPAPGHDAAGDREPPDAVLLDRDGTLVVDVPYNGDPERVEPIPGAREALDRLRMAGIRLAVVSNQSGIGRGILDERRVSAVNRRVEDLLGPLGPWLVCPHDPDAGCDCRKPRPGLVLRAAAALDVEPARCAVVGDIGADVEAARAAGARGLLVPGARTRPEEVAAATETAPDLHAAVDMLIGDAA